MPLAAHRTVPNRTRELQERAWALVGARLKGRICDWCGATYATHDDLCKADLGATCPGINAIESARAAAEEEVGLR